jgi:xylulokinase
MDEGYLLAIDMGTTTARVLLFDLQGRPLVEAYREPPVYHPQLLEAGLCQPPGAELDAEERWECTAELIREVLAQPGIVASRVLAVGLSGLLHALTPVDEQGRVLARAMLWMDQRCQPQVEWMVREHRATLERVMGWAGVSTTFSAPKLRWLAERRPAVVQRARWFLATKDFLRLRLTGTIATDLTDAGGTYLLDPRSKDWAQPVAELVGISREQLPPIGCATEVGGTITAEAARLTGLREGTPVVIGSGDTTCTRIGANAEGGQRGCLYLGTAAWVAVPHARSGTFAATATTGATLKWLVRLLDQDVGEAPGASYISLLQEAEKAAPGAGGLIFLPHLMGERGPQPNAQAKGVLFGLSMAHGRAEMVRAVLEGCAMHLRSILDGLGASEPLVVVGGGAKSALWRQIISDATGRTLIVPDVLEAGALGAAILAGVGVGIYPSVQEASARLVRDVGEHRPEPERMHLYEKIYRVYSELEERVAPLYGRVPVTTVEE